MWIRLPKGGHTIVADLISGIIERVYSGVVETMRYSILSGETYEVDLMR